MKLQLIGHNSQGKSNSGASICTKTIGMLVFALAVSLMMPTGVSASPTYPPEAWDFANASTNFTNGSWSFGNLFTVVSNISMTAVGYYHSGQWSGPHDVALYDGNGTLLVYATVSEGACQDIGHFCFTPIGPIPLSPAQYLIVGFSGNDVYTWNDPGFGFDPRITYDGNNWVSSTSLTFTGFNPINDVGDGYWGPNFLLSGSTPEPGTLALLGTGVLGLGGHLRRRLLG